MRLTNLQTVKRIQIQVRNLVETAGMEVTWKKYRGITAGKPEYGIGDILNYDEKPIRVIIVSPQLPQTQREGGQIVEGQIRIACMEQLGNQDEIVWMENHYRVDSDITPIILGGVVYYQYQLSRAN